MPATASKVRRKKRPAGREIDALIEALDSFRDALVATDAGRAHELTPRNWWLLQAGRFADDPTFPDFAAKLKSARKQDE